MEILKGVVMPELFLYMAVLTVVGGLLLFKGRDMFKPMVSISCFLFIFNIAIEKLGTEKQDLIIAGLCATVVALITGFIIKAGIVIFGIAAGFIAAKLIMPLLPKEITEYKYAVFAVLIVIMVIVFLKSVDLMITISTASNGASLFSLPSMYMITHYKTLASGIGTSPQLTIKHLNHKIFVNFIKDEPMMVTCVVIALTVIGVIVQIKTNRKHVYV